MQDDIILKETKKFKFSWKVFGILMTVVAVVGLVFGILMLVTKEAEVAEVKAECEAASGTPTACPDGTGISGNPILVAEAPEVYTISASSSIFETSAGMTYLNLEVKNGAISGCKMNVRGADGSYNASDCQINGIVGKIYKIAQVNNTNIEGFENALGLIMTDGTVKYVPLNGNSGSSFAVKGTLNIDGFVVDAIGAEVKPNEYVEGSDWSTLFVLKSGKVLKFDEVMLEGM